MARIRGNAGVVARRNVVAQAVLAATSVQVMVDGVELKGPILEVEVGISVISGDNDGVEVAPQGDQPIPVTIRGAISGDKTLAEKFGGVNAYFNPCQVTVNWLNAQNQVVRFDELHACRRTRYTRGVNTGGVPCEVVELDADRIVWG